MYTHTTLLSQENSKVRSWFIYLCFFIFSAYPIYRNFYYSNGLVTYERHIALMENRSEFYNPWQYRILCPYTVEAILWIYNNTADKVYPIEKNSNLTYKILLAQPRKLPDSLN